MMVLKQSEWLVLAGLLGYPYLYGLDLKLSPSRTMQTFDELEAKGYLEMNFLGEVEIPGVLYDLLVIMSEPEWVLQMDAQEIYYHKDQRTICLTLKQEEAAAAPVSSFPSHLIGKSGRLISWKDQRIMLDREIIGDQALLYALFKGEDRNASYHGDH